MVSSIVFAADAPASTLSYQLKIGEIRRLATGVYTTDVLSDPADVVRREWYTIVGRLLPEAVITDRSAPSGGPANGTLYLAHDGRSRDMELSGMTIRARRGSGPLAGDIPYPGGLHLASRGRALAENAQPSRSRDGRQPRTLTDMELEDWVDQLCRQDGEEQLRRYREEAEDLAEQLGIDARHIKKLSTLIGAAIGTQDARTASKALTARQAGAPYDAVRVKRFDDLVAALRASSPQHRPAEISGPRQKHLPFFESYFSNYIEGTRWDVDEALEVVYDGKQVPSRPGDSHDLLGVWRVITDFEAMSHPAESADEFIQLMRERHAEMMAGRPDARPGMFKAVNNRVGGTLFVPWDLVLGTFAEGWRRIGELDTPFERAVYVMYMVSEVHPFDDGNGRTARVMMNAELDQGRQCRIIIPTVFRDDYLGGLRRLSRQDDPSILIKALRYANDYTSQIDFSAQEIALRQLRRTHAFEEPDSDNRLTLPARTDWWADERYGVSVPNTDE